MEGRQEGLEPLDCADDLSSLSGEVEAVGRGDRSMQQCHVNCEADPCGDWPVRAGLALLLLNGQTRLLCHRWGRSSVYPDPDHHAPPTTLKRAMAVVNWHPAVGALWVCA
jgi:hypothetical protein